MYEKWQDNIKGIREKNAEAVEWLERNGFKMFTNIESWWVTWRKDAPGVKFFEFFPPHTRQNGGAEWNVSLEMPSMDGVFIRCGVGATPKDALDELKTSIWREANHG